MLVEVGLWLAILRSLKGASQDSAILEEVTCLQGVGESA